jgi:hypothetical protein
MVTVVTFRQKLHAVDWRDKEFRQNLGEGIPFENSHLEDRSGDIDIKLPTFMFVYKQKCVTELIHLFVRHYACLET